MRFIVALLVCLVSVPAQATWYKVETDKFIFYGTSPKALQEDALRLERFDALLRQRLGISANSEEVKLSIYVLATESEVRKVYGPGSKDIAGFYTANESGLLALMPQAVSIRVAYAFEMVKAGKYGLAATYLQPIANSPHGDDSAKAFQAVVATLRAADADKTKKVTLEQIMQQLSDARAAS